MQSDIRAVIPVYKPDEKLLALLSGLAGQRLPLTAVHIINTEKAEWSGFLQRQQMTEEAFAERFPLVSMTHIRREEFDHGRTRNAGAALCAGADAILFMTQDAVPADDALTEHLFAALSQAENVAVAYARQKAGEQATEAERFARAFNYPPESRVKTEKDKETLGIKAYFCSNVCALYRADLFAGAGGFPFPMIFNEDMVYAGRMMQKGYAVAYAAEAVVIHSHDYTAAQQFSRNFDLGVSQADHPEVFGGISSEGEGMRFVKETVIHLLKKGAVGEIVPFLWRCRARLSGYRLGKNHRSLSQEKILKATGSPEYWRANGLL